jgi:hypothetical protein
MSNPHVPEIEGLTNKNENRRASCIDAIKEVGVRAEQTHVHSLQVVSNDSAPVRRLERIASQREFNGLMVSHSPT